MPFPASVLRDVVEQIRVAQMSPPPPWTIQVEPDRFWPPGPESGQFHVLGQMPSGANSPGVTSTVSKVTTEPVPWLCEVIAKSASSDPGMLRVCGEPGIALQVLPSGEA